MLGSYPKQNMINLGKFSIFSKKNKKKNWQKEFAYENFDINLHRISKITNCFII